MAKVTGINARTKTSAVPPAAPGLSADQQRAIEAAGEATARMGRVDRVFHWDKRQGAQVWADANDKILTPEQLAADELAETAHAVSHAIGGARPTLIRHHLVQAPTVLVCGHDKTHGKLIMHGSGSLLVCTASKGGAPCTFNQPVSL